jgi:two-component system cell cycle response regulator
MAAHQEPHPLADALQQPFRGEPSMAAARAGVVLVVDDDHDTCTMTARQLARANFHCVQAVSGEQAVERAYLDADAIDAIVLDVKMHDIDGFEVARRLHRSDRTSDIPILFVSGQATLESDVVRGVESGAYDYLSKPVSPAVLVAKVRSATERGRRERELRKQLRFAEAHATTDPLTGLFNRWNMEARLVEECAYVKRHHKPLAVVMIDLDYFKSINDTYGHTAGDRVLVHVADCIRSVLRQHDSAYRYGGEEFLLLLRECDALRAGTVADRLRLELRRQHGKLAEDAVTLTFSAGIAAADERNGFRYDELVVRADAALYRAKRDGRNRVEIEG